MTASVTLFHRARRFLAATLVLGLALWWNTGALQAQMTQTATSSNRFLFIIDTSSAMKPFEKGVEVALFDMVSSGLRGKMTNGDTYGIWLVNKEIDMSFTMQMWRDKFKVEMAARAGLHVQEHGYRGKLDVNLFMKDALAVTRGVGDLTIIFISNGETPIAQTPFDEFINAKVRELAPVMKRKKATINTALVAQDGKLVAWGVNSPDFVIEIPYVAPKPKPAPIVIKPTPKPTNTPPVVVAAAVPVIVTNLPAKARPNASPIIITKDLVAQERRQFLAMASTLTNEPNAWATTNAASTNTNPVAATISSNAAPTNVVETKPAAIVAPPVATSAVATITKPESTNVATVTVSVSMPPASTPAAAAPAASAQPSPDLPASSESHAILWVALGAGVMFVCMLSVMLVMRSRRPEPSLVSQAILRERIRTS